MTTGVELYQDLHGHVVPRPDGVRARCGGVALCRHCQGERAAVNAVRPALEQSAGLVRDLSRTVAFARRWAKLWKNGAKAARDGEAWRREYVAASGREWQRERERNAARRWALRWRALAKSQREGIAAGLDIARLSAEALDARDDARKWARRWKHAARVNRSALTRACDVLTGLGGSDR